MKRRSISHVMQGAALLSIASLIAKILSAVYRVPFQNMVSNTGFYVYQQVYPIYGIGMTIALSGLPMFISKLVAETTNLGEQRALLQQVTWLLSGFSVGAFLLLQLFSATIARGMGDLGLTPIIQSVSWMFLFAPILSVSRGFFQGHFDMVPTAVSQLIEQVVRVSVILSVAFIAMKFHWNVYRMGSWAMSSAPVAAVFASAVMIYYWRRSAVKKVVSQAAPVQQFSNTVIAKRVLIEGGAISLLASMMVLLQLVDSFSVMRGLVDGGLPAMAAKALKGVFDRSQPLVQLGLVVASAFASSLLPSLTEALGRGRQLQFERLAKTVLRISLVIATAAAVGMMALMPQINQVLFGDTSGSAALDVYALSVIFATLITILNSILQSMNHYRETVIALSIGLVVKAFLNHYMVVHFGIAGASWATVLALAAMTTLLLQRVPALKSALLDRPFITKLIVTSGGMLLGVRLAVTLVQSLGLPPFNSGRLDALVVIVVGIPVGVALFVWLAVKSGLLTPREWLMVPYVPTLLKRLHR
ncbi:putative polysaccharide biosynthesis protein [Secundilactobacillus kimchicus]|uniref:putative polysaccharide biosynthesis protein n=1 Tax=Secundilactobacillus kimchicus TaxID=528209 RepID=UPI0024A9DD89|nr:polysaccharide biosynthesis protein [Secundilactobacillus kimchicus]